MMWLPGHQASGGGAQRVGGLQGHLSCPILHELLPFLKSLLMGELRLHLEAL